MNRIQAARLTDGSPADKCDHTITHFPKWALDVTKNETTPEIARSQIMTHDDIPNAVLPLSAKIFASSDPSETLLNILIELGEQHEIAIELFEAVAGRIRISHYWVYYKIATSYSLTQQDKACFLSSIMAIQMEPDYPNWHVYLNVYRYFKKNYRYKDAYEIARHQIGLFPESPIVSQGELMQTMRYAEVVTADLSSSQYNYKTASIFSASTFTLKVDGRYGATKALSTSLALEGFARSVDRAEVTVAEFEDAEVIICDGNILVLDSGRNLVNEISICEFPESLYERVRKERATQEYNEEYCDLLLVISDKYVTANVCHNLFDHITRLAVYAEVCDISSATVIGPEISADFQRVMLERTGCREYRSARDRRVIRSKRFLITNTCKKDFQHPAHLGAEWAICYLQKQFHCSGEVLANIKIYVTRKDAAARHIRNEAAILSLLKSFGFREVSLSDLPYLEQVDLFKRSSHVVGMHGAGLSNIVFCQPGTCVLEVHHPTAGTAAYAVIGCQSKLTYSCLVGVDAERPDDPIYNDYQAALANAALAGADLSGNRDVIIDEKELLRWLKDSGVDDDTPTGAAEPDKTIAEISVVNLTESILSSEDIDKSLLSILLALKEKQDLKKIIQVFESVFSRTKISNYWVLAVAADTYEKLALSQASFLVYAMARGIEVSSSAEFFINRSFYFHFKDQNAKDDCLRIFNQHCEHFPDSPFLSPSEINTLLSQRPKTRPPRKLAFDIKRINVEPSTEMQPPAGRTVYGKFGRPIYANLANGLTRNAIDVCIVKNAIVYASGNKAIVISDRDVIEELCSSESPALMMNVYHKNKGDLPIVELDRAILLSDRWGGENYAHFLLDHLSRISLYAKAGVGARDTTVLGTEIKNEFQREILLNERVKRYVSLGQPKIIRVNELFVSSNVADLQHIGHLGAPWVVDYLKDEFEAHGQPKSRLYISRKDANGRRVVNEAEVVHYLSRFGFKEIVPGRMSVEQQIATFAEASHVIGMHGAAMTNTVFAPKGLRYLEFFHPLWSNDCFAMLSGALEMDVSALVGSDGYSDEKEFNDIGIANAVSAPWPTRDIRVDIKELGRWIDANC